MHVLAFNDGLFEYFNDKLGNYYNADEMFKKGYYLGKSASILATP